MKKMFLPMLIILIVASVFAVNKDKNSISITGQITNYQADGRVKYFASKPCNIRAV